MDRQKMSGGAPGQMNPVPQSKTTPPDMAMIIVMIIVLAIILLFCFWGAPGIRAYCRRKICSRCPMDEPRERSGTPGGDDRSTTPTIILLPFGRMLVVDRTVITQLQADQTGIDFMELSANLIRAHHLRYSSTPSILDSDTTSKGLSPISLGYSPPSYDDIFGGKTNDLPPSYSELSLLFRQRQMESNEMRNFNFGSMTARDKETVRETILDIASESMCNATKGRNGQQKEIQSYGEIGITVPSNFQESDLPLNADSISVVNEDINYSKYKYGVMMLGSDRSARIKCYCCEDSTHAKNSVSATRSADDIGCSSSARREVHNNSECSIRTIEVSAMDHNTFSDNATDYGGDSTNPNNYSKCTLNHSYSNEETCKRSCEEIRESRL